MMSRGLEERLPNICSAYLDILHNSAVTYLSSNSSYVNGSYVATYDNVMELGRKIAEYI